MTNAKLWTTIEAADYLHLQPSTLEKWRVTGKGPKYLALGKRAVRYDPDTVIAWCREQVRSSTSDDGGVH